MKHNYDIKMSYTDNPYIDLLVYHTKCMALNCIVKNENEALKYETLESRQESNKLIAFKQGMKMKEPFYEESYEEKNNYYRKLNGLPPLPSSDEEEAYIKKYGYNTVDPMTGHVKELLEYAYIPMEQYQHMIPEDNYIDLTGRFLHELSSDERKMLEQYGIGDIIRETYNTVDYDYMYHMDEMKIDPYIARTAENFTLLYCPSIPFVEIHEKFKRMFDRNRMYTLTAIYSDAYKYGSSHYDNFIQILLIIQTMIDIISEVQEYIINKDVFDSRTIRYLFESYGIAYYKEIDIKYQLRIIKNVHQLLKYKSTNINIQDIVDIFDNPDIDIYTYYLMKVKKLPKEELKYYTEDDVNPKYVNNKTFYIAENNSTNNRYPIVPIQTFVNDSKFQDSIEVVLVSEIMAYYKIPPADIASYKALVQNIRHMFIEILKGPVYMNQYYYRELKDAMFEHLSNNPIYGDYSISSDKLIMILDKALPYTSNVYGWINMGDLRTLLPNVTEDLKNREIVIRPNMPIYTESSFYQIITEDMVGTEKFSENYNLAFLRVPISEPNASAYIEDTSCRRSYDSITSQDPFWDGISKADILTEEEKTRYHNEKRNEILSKDFDIERTKYISVDAAIDITKMSYKLSYFMNILYDEHIDEELLQLDVDSRLSTNRVRLNDLLSFTTALNYLYNGVHPDIISSDMEKNMTINGFDFDTDWTAIYNELNNRQYIYNEVLQPMNQGSLVEFTKQQLEDIQNDRVPVIEPNNGAFLSGRYGKCTCSDKDPDQIGYSIKWEEMKHYKIIDTNENYSSYTWNGWEGYSYPTYLEPYLYATGDTSIFGSYSVIDPVTGEEHKGYDEFGNRCHYIDITWDTIYGDEENSHCNFMNTDIFNTMNNDEYSDLQRFNKLKEIYTNNTNLYDHLVYMMNTADDKRTYDIYHTLFESFMETEMSYDFYSIYDSYGNLVYEDSKGNTYKYTIISEEYEMYNGNKVYYDSNNNRYVYRYNNDHEYYCTDNGDTSTVVKDASGNPLQDAEGSYIPSKDGLYPLFNQEVSYVSSLDGSKVETVYNTSTGRYEPVLDDIKPKLANDYYEFLQYRNVDLYNHLVAVTNYSNLDEQKSAIMTLCTYVSSALDQYFDSKEWNHIYNQIPSHNLQFIQQCILKIVMFFKSWKTQMLDQSISYAIDDNYHNRVRILDDMYMSSSHSLHDKIRQMDFNERRIYTSYNDKVTIRDVVEFYIWYDLYQATKEDFIYYISNNEVTLVRYIGKHTALKVPETVEDKPVKVIEEPCFAYTNVTTVEIPEGILYIK